MSGDVWVDWRELKAQRDAAIARAEAAEQLAKENLSFVEVLRASNESISVERDDLRAKLAATEYELAHADAELAAARKFDMLKELSDRAIAAEADNAALVKALNALANTLDESAYTEARAALASPHPGAELLEAVWLAWDVLTDVHVTNGADLDSINHAVSALRPWAGEL